MYSMTSVKSLEFPDQQLERKFLMLRTGALLGSLWLLEGTIVTSRVVTSFKLYIYICT